MAAELIVAPEAEHDVAEAFAWVDDKVTVYCVFHTSRDPEKWRQRLP